MPNVRLSSLTLSIPILIVHIVVGVTMYVNMFMDCCVSLTNFPSANPRILLWPVVSEASGLKWFSRFTFTYFPVPNNRYLARACAF